MTQVCSRVEGQGHSEDHQSADPSRGQISRMWIWTHNNFPVCNDRHLKELYLLFPYLLQHFCHNSSSLQQMPVVIPLLGNYLSLWLEGNVVQVLAAAVALVVLVEEVENDLCQKQYFHILQTVQTSQWVGQLGERMQHSHHHPTLHGVGNLIQCNLDLVPLDMRVDDLVVETHVPGA